MEEELNKIQQALWNKNYTEETYGQLYVAQ